MSKQKSGRQISAPISIPKSLFLAVFFFVATINMLTPNLEDQLTYMWFLATPAMLPIRLILAIFGVYVVIISIVYFIYAIKGTPLLTVMEDRIEINGLKKRIIEKSELVEIAENSGSSIRIAMKNGKSIRIPVLFLRNREIWRKKIVSYVEQQASERAGSDAS